MKKIINSIPYSTDSSCRLGYFQHRTILDPTYCREELYITRQGTYFLYVEEEKAVPTVSKEIRFRPQDVTSQF